MEICFYIISCLLLLVNMLPFVSHQHWLFRVWDFGRIQILFLLGVLFLASFIIFETTSINLRIIQILLLLNIGYNCKVLIPYTKLYKKEKNSTNTNSNKKSISIIAANVYQFNTNYEKLISLIKSRMPDIVLTMESNLNWEKALSALEEEYPHFHKMSLENTYGMHFFSKLKIISSKTNYFVAKDVPSFEIVLETVEKDRITFFGVHPPPPSPTEEANSKERDGELLSVAKEVKKSSYPVIVCGDFNNVAWGNSSILFKKKSALIDPRIGRGFVSTFHAKYKLLRFPIDLFFHSETIFIKTFTTLDPIGSDHLPLYCEFVIANKKLNNDTKESTDSNEDEEIEEVIEEGKKENSDREEKATE